MLNLKEKDKFKWGNDLLNNLSEADLLKAYKEIVRPKSNAENPNSEFYYIAKGQMPPGVGSISEDATLDFLGIAGALKGLLKRSVKEVIKRGVTKELPNNLKRVVAATDDIYYTEEVLGKTPWKKIINDKMDKRALDSYTKQYNKIPEAIEQQNKYITKAPVQKPVNLVYDSKDTSELVKALEKDAADQFTMYDENYLMGADAFTSPGSNQLFYKNKFDIGKTVHEGSHFMDNSGAELTEAWQNMYGSVNKWKFDEMVKYYKDKGLTGDALRRSLAEYAYMSKPTEMVAKLNEIKYMNKLGPTVPYKQAAEVWNQGIKSIEENMSTNRTSFLFNYMRNLKDFDAFFKMINNNPFPTKF